jgi:hypothetical protein
MSDKYVSLRNFSLRSLTGHTVHFVAGVPTYVPPPVRRECMAHGIMPADGSIDESVKVSENKITKPFQVTGGLRRSVIYKAIESLVETNSPESFDGGSRPKTEPLARLTGFPVQKKETIELFELFQGNQSTGELGPTHPKTDMWFGVLEISNIDEAKMYAEELKVQNDLDGMSVAEARKLLQVCLAEGG